MMNKGWYWVGCMLLLCSGASLAQTDAAVSQPSISDTPNLREGIEVKKVSDIEAFLKDKKTGEIEDHAQALAEIDEWLFSSSEERQVKALLEKEVSELRSRIGAEVGKLSKSALDAPTGKVATEYIARISSLMALYPSPEDEATRSRLNQLTSNIADTSRRVIEIQRLRYNQWAIKRIQFNLDHYRQIVKVNLDRLKATNMTDWRTAMSDLKTRLGPANKDALIQKCIEGMSEIDPALLEPVVMDLYNYAYGKTRDAMGDDDAYLIKLANGFANPAVKRVPLSNF